MPEPTPTPILNFVRAYAQKDSVRMHMPGHKGKPLLGCEPWDITEIDGADALFEANGIIAESERYAGEHFGTQTFYSTEGSSLCIRAMVYLSAQRVPKGKRAKLIAARNAHKTFLSAVALLDCDVCWLYPKADTALLSSDLTPEIVAEAIRNNPDAAAVYCTAPDYLGNIPDIAGIATVCHAAGVPLLVDNAHGAYLKFLPVSRHPIDLGADLCCDSAHKTLPALTGAAYLHVPSDDRFDFAAHAKDALALFGSTSPSYLILQSLDAVNRELDGFSARLAAFLPRSAALRLALRRAGYTLVGDEPLKVAIDAKAYGYTGTELKDRLTAGGIVPEFADPDYLVLMLSPWLTNAELERTAKTLLQIEQRGPIERSSQQYLVPEIACSVREAMLADAERLPLSLCEGRVLAAPCVGCPPAVPILMCGERIDRNAMQRFAYYGTETLLVVKNR